MAKSPVKPAAKSAAKPPAKGGKTKNKGDSKATKVLVFPVMLICAASFFVFSISIIAFAGFIPTLVTVFTDKSRAKTLSVCVGALNAAAITYIIVQLLQQGGQSEHAVRVLQDPANWVIMWGGAGLGLALHTLIPPVVAQVLTTLSEFRLQKIKTNQAEIRKIWGEDVKGVNSDK